MDSETSLSSMDSQLHHTPTETDGFEYFAGFVAKKLKTEFPYMGNYTFELQQHES